VSEGNEKARAAMVANQIAARGLKDPRVLEAMRKVPRELFVKESDEKLAFSDGPLTIGYGQTISQPYIVAYMTECLDIKRDDRVLEIGTGSGYQTAVLAELAAEVCTIEIVEDLSIRARRILKELGYGNIRFKTGDGSRGWGEGERFDDIMVTAAPRKVPGMLLKQLEYGGRMILPVGGFVQNLKLITREEESYREDELISVRFVPMTGEVD
jgi:protein-L-isoaspartate(D-aspartate) O-methyltransferase